MPFDADKEVEKLTKGRKLTPAQQRQIIAFVAQKQQRMQNRLAETKKLADNITNVSKGNSAITDIRNTLRKRGN